MLFRVEEPAAALRRLWSLTAPGGHLVVQDYDLHCIDVRPALATVDECKRVVLGAFTAAGRDVGTGDALPLLFAQAGLGGCRMGPTWPAGSTRCATAGGCSPPSIAASCPRPSRSG